MPKTHIRPSDIPPCQFEGDFFAELSKSLAKPLMDERPEPTSRCNKRTRRWGRVMEDDGYRPSYKAGHRSRRNVGRKARARK